MSERQIVYVITHTDWYDDYWISIYKEKSKAEDYIKEYNKKYEKWESIDYVYLTVKEIL